MAVALSPKGKPARSTWSRCCVLTGDSVLWDLEFLLVVKAEPTDGSPASAVETDTTSGARVAAVDVFKCTMSLN